MREKKIRLRSVSRALALEPRLLFDGAGALAAADAAQPDSDQLAAQSSAHEAEVDQVLFTSFAAPVTVSFSVVDGKSAGPRVTSEDEPLKIEDITLSGNDLDPDDPVTLVIITQGGTSSLSGQDVAVTGDGTSEISVTGKLADINQALKSLTYTPDQNQNSATTGFDPRITLVDENGNRLDLVISVTPVNDDPVLSDQMPLEVREGETRFFSLEQLAPSWEALDVDILTGQQVKEQLVLIIDSLPEEGELTFNGGAVGVGQVIAVTDLDKLSYKASGKDLGSKESFTFQITVKDGGGGEASGKISIDVLPKNLKPTVGNTDQQIVEGETKVVAPSIDLGDAFDSLLTAEIVIDQVVTGGQGEFFFDFDGDNRIGEDEKLVIASDGKLVLTEQQRTNLDKLKFKHNGNEPNAPGTIAPSYRITVTDAGGGEGESARLSSEATTVTLHVIPNNDDPTLDNAHASIDQPLRVEERTGSTVANLQGLLKVEDGDYDASKPGQKTPAEQLVYTIGAPPSQGEIQLYVGGAQGYGGDGWITLGEGGRFTQADVDAGHVRYYQTTNVAVDTPDVFTFSVRDSAFGYEIDADGVNTGRLREGAVRDASGNVADNHFHILIQASQETPTHADYEGEPRPPTPGYGDEHVDYDFKAVVVNPGNNAAGANGIWNEGNVGAADGGYVISQQMLDYEIHRSFDKNGVSTTLVVPANETVYTVTAQPPNGQLQQKVGNHWVDIQTNGQFTQQQINDGEIRFVSDGSEHHTATFGFTVSDGSSKQPFQGHFSIDITPTNDRPTAHGGTVQVQEGAGQTVYLGSNVVGMADVDKSLDPNKQTIDEGVEDYLWFQVTKLPEHGKLERWNGSAWEGVVVGEWMPSELLNTSVGGEGSGLRYVHDGSEPLAYAGGKPVVSFDYLVRDDLLAPAGGPFVVDLSSPADSSNTLQSNISEKPATVTINIVPVNDAPLIQVTPKEDAPHIDDTISGGGKTDAFNKLLEVDEGGKVTIDSGYLVAIDRDNTTTQRQYQLTTLPEHGQLMLGGKVLGLGSTFTQADIDSNRLEYKHNGDEPDDLTVDGYNDFFKFQVSDGAKTTVEGSFWIAVIPVNDAPTIEAHPGNRPTNGNQQNLWVIDSANGWTDMPKVVIGDPDLANGLQGQEKDYIKVTVELDDASGLYANGMLQIKGQSDGGDLQTLRISGSDSSRLVLEGKLEDVQHALDLLQAKSKGLANGGDADKSGLKLRLTVDDRLDGGGANGGGTKNSDGTPFSDENNTRSMEFNIAVSERNDPPVIALPADSRFVVNEDVQSLLAGLSFSDADDFGIGQYTLTLDVAHGTLKAGGESGKHIVLSGSMQQLNQALANLQYKADSNFNGKDRLSIKVNDNGGFGKDDASTLNGEDSQDVDIFIRPVNDAPVLTLPGDGTSVPVTNGGYIFSNANGNAIQVADIDAEDPLNDGKGAGHQLADPDSIFTVTLSAKDGEGNPAGLISFEQQPVPAGVSVTLDAGGEKIVKGSLAAVNAFLAQGVKFTANDANLDGAVTFKVTVNDGGNGGELLEDDDLHEDGIGDGLEDSKSIVFLVTDQNSAPTITLRPDKPVYEQGRNAGITLDPNADLSDAELDLFNDWGGAVLTITQETGTPGGEFGFTSGVEVKGSAILVGGKHVAEIEANADGELSIRFVGKASSAEADAVLKAVTYKNENPGVPREITLNFLIVDGNPNGGTDQEQGTGQDQGSGGQMQGRASLTVIMDRAVGLDMSSPDLTVYENSLVGGTGTGTVSGSFTVTVPDGLADSAAITVGGKALSKSQVEELAQSDKQQTIDTAYGTLVLNDYAANADGTITISYTYVLDTAPTIAGTQTTDTIGVKVRDVDGSSKTAAIGVVIVDDEPTATADRGSVDEGATLTVDVKDGVLSNDNPGADGWAGTGAVVGVASGADASAAVGSGVGVAIQGSYGTLTLHADGSYTYVSRGDSITGDVIDVFSYVVRDADGDEATATLSIDVRNISLVSTAADGTVKESGLAGGSTEGSGHSVDKQDLGLPAGHSAVPA
ncbi:cadherin-like domain-containing protein, partial [Comamonas composti]|uniref:cadherin-like domain-containing protein n=1 Tax=Comamonas composti TaxID=408558 RepID=UPI0005525297